MEDESTPVTQQTQEVAASTDAAGNEESDVGLRDFVSGTFKTLPRLVSRRWWWVTLLVILGMAGLVRLGFWQFDRLEQRRAFNRLVADRWNQPFYDLQAEVLPGNLKELEYRRIEVQGEPDYQHQMVLTNQPGPNGEAGVILLTPYVMENGKAVILARGWVPQEYADPARWPEVVEPEGAPVVGLIQESQSIDSAPPLDGFQTEWYRVDIPLMAQTLPYDILPAFVLQLPEEDRDPYQFPIRTQPFALDEGNHLSYAIQWILFAVILGIGYIQYVRWLERRELRMVPDRYNHIESMHEAQAYMTRDQFHQKR